MRGPKVPNNLQGLTSTIRKGYGPLLAARTQVEIYLRYLRTSPRYLSKSRKPLVYAYPRATSYLSIREYIYTSC